MEKYCVYQIKTLTCRCCELAPKVKWKNDLMFVYRTSKDGTDIISFKVPYPNDSFIETLIRYNKESRRNDKRRNR